MDLNRIKFRSACEDDAKALLDVYAPYVEETAITFEYEVPSVEEFRRRVRTVLEFYPYIVAEYDGKIIGYAYASAFHPRAAYKWAVELSIYLDMDCRGLGLGRKFYELLEAILKEQHFLNLYASIAKIDCDDQHLTDASVKFHACLGYKTIGTFLKCGYKFNTWYDTVWMEKIIGVHETPPLPLLPFSAVKDQFGL